ncbi:hypothetical protein Ccrd_010492 [Cynara cardunculus var. scolymus]|uniref:Uncharacterized protein n=1 Tax=Cynara cardunculus var. scolymus TaxID=59895 RepID=A0A118K6S0_CYNCS|nr:hypothetical protein Ccrd_010492 [Cynara cardunculus var. scolymus]
MAPTRKSRSVNKRYSDYVEVSPSKSVANKSGRQKRKLSDMIGSPWTDEEVERFYKAYRKYGKDWKKVAAMVRTRNSVMVEALYTMNRAYLSLPEGTASVVGFIAMVSDHYNALVRSYITYIYLIRLCCVDLMYYVLCDGVNTGAYALNITILEGSNSDHDDNEFPKLIPKPRKRSHGLFQQNGGEDQLQSRLAGSSDRPMSQLKRRESDGCTVRKRTPRFPINHSSRRDNSGFYVSPYKRSQKREVDDVAHGAALALTEASQRGGSPQVSQSPYRIDRMKTTPLKGRQKTLDTARTKLHGNLIDEDCFEGSSGSGGAENGAYPRDASIFMDTENVAAEDVHQKGRKFYSQKDDNEFDDGGEACSGTGEGLAVGSIGGKFDIEVADENIEQSSSQGKRKRNKKLYFRANTKLLLKVLSIPWGHAQWPEGLKFGSVEGALMHGLCGQVGPKDETSGLDALQTLADLSLMIQSSKVDSESPVLKEDKPPTGISDNNVSGRPGSNGHRRHKTKMSVDKEKLLNEFPRADASKSGKSKPGRESKVDYKALSEGKQLDQSINKSWKRKNKSSSFEALFNDEEKCASKPLCANQDNVPSKNCKSTRLVEYSSSNSNTSRTGADSAVSTALLPASDGVDLPFKRRNKRKVDPNRISNHGEMKLAKINLKDQPNKKIEPQEGTLYLKDKAFCCLSSCMVRRWSTYEWFYSAIDYPWFAKREFVEYLNHVGLGHIPRLTKVEWGVIRSSLGKPRRFSRNFLHEEREKLWQYRESVRKHYTELRSGIREGLPTDLARPLSVGQRVIALHPESREVHDGSVLTVDHDKCRIQFDRPELGVAFVKDIDCMPLNLLDNMPEALRRESSALYRFSMNSGEPRLPQSATGSSMLYTSREHFEQSPTIALMSQRPVSRLNDLLFPVLGHNGSGAPAKAEDNVISQHAPNAPPCSVSQIQAKETDIRALSELTRALDKKEAILAELKLVNDGLMSHENETGIAMKVSESFKKEYAMVLLQLKEASDQACGLLMTNSVSSALLNLRQRNTYPGNPLPPWQKLHSSSSGIIGPTSSADNFPSNNQLAPSVVEIVNNSRLEAHKLVHTAVQAMSKIKVEQNVLSSVVAVLDSLGVGKNPIEYGSSTIRHSEQPNGGTYKHKLNCTPDTSLNNHASDSKLQRESDETEATIPFELIVSCVATYHMIQMCTERQYPPADVVQMLDSAFTNLHPHCPQNLPIFREIQMCMGRVKTQILALVPS